MAWIGKVGGGILGFLVGGPPGAIIGTALGHQFDRGAGQGDRLRGLGYDPADAGIWSAADRQRLFFETTFYGLGALAKADGRVSEEELDSARTVMANMHLPPASGASGHGLLHAGQGPGFPAAGACRQAPPGLPQPAAAAADLPRDPDGFSARQGGDRHRRTDAAAADGPYAGRQHVRAHAAGSGTARPACLPPAADHEHAATDAGRAPIGRSISSRTPAMPRSRKPIGA